MKPITVLLFVVLTLMSCTSAPKGPAYDFRATFPALLEQHPRLVELGAKVKEVRFSGDYEKVLVIVETPDPQPAGAYIVPEFVLTHDGFGRYFGPRGVKAADRVMIDLQED